MFELLDPVVEVSHALRHLIDPCGTLQAIVFGGPRDHVRRVGSEVLARLAVEPPPLVAAMVHLFIAAQRSRLGS